MATTPRRLLRARRYAAGLCVHCAGRRDCASSRCETCRAKAAADERKRREREAQA